MMSRCLAVVCVTLSTIGAQDAANALGGTRIHGASDSILIGGPATGALRTLASGDDRLGRLIDRFSPHALDARVESAAGNTETVLYLDYPFNDAANNHEGDWEHLNVVLTTRRRERAVSEREARLSELELRHLLAGDLPVDSLSIATVEYFFHESYVVLDYLAARRASSGKRSREFLHFLSRGPES